MSRAEFTKATKRAARERAKGFCEARGERYGFLPDMRCGMPFGHSVEFDHIILDANSHDNSLRNCACVCIPCHRWKTRYVDPPLAAKTLRQQDKHRGIKRPKRKSKYKRKVDGSTVLR